MRKIRRVLAVLICCLYLGALLLAGVVFAGEADHPLVSRYPGSSVEKREVKEFDEYTLIVGLEGKKAECVGKPLEGKITRIVYRNPPGRSTLEIFRNYQDALQQANREMLFQCAGEECGPTYSSSRWNR